MGLKKRVEAYAKTVNCAMKMARIHVRYFDRMRLLIHAASICPKCGKPTLEMEGGSYEEGIEAYVYCSNDRVPEKEDGETYYTDCGFYDDAKDKYTPISHWFDFDIVLALALDGTAEKEYFGDWERFVEKDTESLLKEAI
ncbi:MULTISPECIES: hypothetical protein [unclassified Brevibacillus]|uniref:hypothetical protein n=1 Tax=unclassified Brevibacillus TaxID=2684853 RepID=UPI003568E7CE